MSEKTLYVTVDVGGTKIFGAVFDRENHLLAEEKIKTNSEKGINVVEQNIFDVIRLLIERTKGMGTISAIGMGVPGIVNQTTGEVIFSPNIYFRNYPLRRTIYEEFEIPCFLENDVNLGLLGEWKYGEKQRFSNGIGFFVGTGVGGAIMLDGKICSGHNGWAGEFGHIVLDSEGPFCGCGQRGCLEAYAGKHAIYATIKGEMTKGRDTMLKDFIRKEGAIRGKMLKKAIKENDEVALEVIRSVGRYLGRAAGMMINIFNPQVIIFGGGVIEASKEVMMEEIQKNVQRFAIANLVAEVEIIPAKLGDYSVLYGGKALIERNLEGI